MKVNADAGVAPEEAVGTEQVAQQVLAVAPKAPAGKGPGPVPPQLKHLHMQRLCQALQSLHLQHTAALTHLVSTHLRQQISAGRS